MDFLISGHTISDELKRLAEFGNKPFIESLHPGIENILGIRIPDLRILAKEIARSDWPLYLSNADSFYMEERILQGLVLGYINPSMDVDAYLQWVTNFVHLINSWSVCDTFTFAGGKAWVKKNSERLWNYVTDWMNASREYEVRFGVVMAMKYFIDESYINLLLDKLSKVNHNGYYVKMAVAWTLSVCFVEFPERTFVYLQKNDLDDFTFNKSIQKIIESHRIPFSVKQQVKILKRR